MNENKKNRGFIVVIIILIMIVLGLVFYICYDKELIFNKNSHEDSVKKIENKEKEITDIDIKKELTGKINQVLSLGSSNDVDIDKIDYYHSYGLGISNYEDYSNSDKLLTALNLSQDSFRQMTKEEIELANNNQEFSNAIGVIEEGNLSGICEDLSIIDKKYQELFGDVPTYKTIGMYYYDLKNQSYYYKFNGATGAYPHIIGYIYNYTEKDDEVYTYFVLGTIDDEENIYTDFVLNEEEERDSLKYDQSLTNDLIDESNYQDFSKYKITFKKNKDGDYYFSKFSKN